MAATRRSLPRPPGAATGGGRLVIVSPALPPILQAPEAQRVRALQVDEAAALDTVQPAAHGSAPPCRTGATGDGHRMPQRCGICQRWKTWVSGQPGTPWT